MARRKASSPKIPADTLARARAQAALTPPPAEPASTPMSEAAPTPAPAAVSTRKRLEEKRERERKKADLDGETIKQMLLNPTKFPTAEDLKHDYVYVTRDLRNMFLLTAALMAFMFVLAAVAPGL